MKGEVLKNQPLISWPRIIEGEDADIIVRLATRHVANTLSDMVKREIKLSNLQIETVALNELTLSFSDPEAEMVGVYLCSGDDLPGQAILILSLDDAMYLADWLLELRPGTTSKLGELEYSALAEVGNVSLSAFLNALASFTDSFLRLSPPAVTIDMLAAVLEVIATSTAMIADETVVIKADFKDVHDSIQLYFWVLPDPAVFNRTNGSGKR
jgi:chemotaxis protein CheC